MLLRTLVAAAGIPVFVGLCAWGTWPFAIGCSLLAFGACLELARALAKDRGGVSWPIALLGVALCPLVAAGPSPGGAWNAISAAAALIGLAIGCEVVRAGRTGALDALPRIANGALIGLYTSLFAGLPALRLGTNSLWLSSISVSGLQLVVWVAVCVWTTDSFAYFTGRAIGKRKLAPTISPGKTVEGALGGLLASVIVGGAIGYFWFGSLVDGKIIGLAAGILSQVGDLFASLLKRNLGIKDFGTLIPGHGGVLDRFDSLMLVSSVVSAMLHLGDFAR